MSATRAFIRRPSPRLADGELTHLARTPVDVARAYAQHAAYVEALRGHGLALVALPDLPEQPDAVFVEDVLVWLDGRLVLTRPGAASRRGELASVVTTLQHLQLGFDVIEAPATLDGGDVLVLDRHVLVGRSTRSNDAARAQLAAFLHARTPPSFAGAPAEALEVAPMPNAHKPVLGIDVAGALHLKTALTRLPDGSVIAASDSVDTTALAALGYRVHLAAEPSGADVLCLGTSVLLPADAPQTARALRELGFAVETLDISELQKLEAGMTCMSVLW